MPAGNRAELVRGVRALPFKGVTVRKARAEDLPAIRACIRPIYDEPRFNDGKRDFHLWRVGSFYDRFPHVVDEEFWGKNNERRYVLVLEAKRSGRIVGVAALIQPEDGDHLTGEISKVYLAPEYRGLGLGRWMLEILLREGRKLGYERLGLTTRIEFEDAIAVYKKVGFRQVPNTKYPGVLNSIAMLYEYPSR